LAVPELRAVALTAHNLQKIATRTQQLLVNLRSPCRIEAWQVSAAQLPKVRRLRTVCGSKGGLAPSGSCESTSSQ